MESMEEIYQNHSKKVYTFLLSKTCNHELAEELTQETFFCAVNSINKFKGNSSVLTWLCGIAQNLWLKYLRDNKSFEDLSKLDIENPIIRINTAFKGCSSLEKISVLPRIYHN